MNQISRREHERGDVEAGKFTSRHSCVLGEHAALMLAVFLLPVLWNSLILLIDRLANTAKEEKEITA